MARLVFTWLAAWLFLLSGTKSWAKEPPPASAAEPAPSGQHELAAQGSLWQRIVLVGASATAGFIETEPFGGPNSAHYSLSRYVDAALRVPHQPVRTFASALLFIQPDAAGRREMDEALRAKPTLLVGLDFLFWYCYGTGTNDAARLRHFEQGLKLLEPVHCPLILGDIPDASGAVGTMLAPEQVPSAAVIAAANRRLKKWAASRPHVVIIPLSKFMRDAMANRPITVHGHTLAQGHTRALLQPDKLHPSPLGCAVLALSILDAALSHNPAASTNDILWNPQEVCRRGYSFRQNSQPVSKPATATRKGG